MEIRRLASVYIDGRFKRREIVRETRNRSLSVLRAFAKVYGNRKVKGMTRLDIERWVISRAHLSIGTLHYEVVVIRGFVRWLQRERRVLRDPMEGIHNPKVPRSVPRALAIDEVSRLIAVLPDARARAAVMLMLGLGLRRAEVVSLQMGDWDRVAGTLRVTGKGRHVRLLPVPERVTEAMNTYILPTTAGPLIRKENGRGGLTKGYLGQLMTGWLRESGVKVAAFDGKGCHSLRHTLASDVADIEPDLRVLQSILGHTSLSSTQVYLRHAEMSKVRATLDGIA